MAEKQNIDERVDEKIDDKIADAQLTPARRMASLASRSNLDTAENVASKTTAEQDLRTAGQREINLIWERTQRHIALFVVVLAGTVSSIVVVASVVKGGGEPSSLVLAAFTLLSNISFLVAGFYFGRTNHARIGDNKPAPGLDDR
jgi:hypothetical protein